MPNPLFTLNPSLISVQQSDLLKFGFAAANTAYALNNGGGLTVGEPLLTLQDSALANMPGARSLQAEIPQGFTVEGIYKSSTTGLDVYMASNPITKQVVIGIAGTNGFGVDARDTPQAPHTVRDG